MNRRELIFGLGGLVSTGSLIAGSSAFSSTAGERSLTVSVSTDETAFLGLTELGAGGRSDVGDGVVKFAFPSFKETSPRAGGDPDLGLGTDSVYEFFRDAEEGQDGTKGLLRITNQGTQPISVSTRFETDAEIEVELFDVSDPEREALRESEPTLKVGDSVTVGFRIQTFDVAPKDQDYKGDLVIIGGE